MDTGISGEILTAKNLIDNAKVHASCEMYFNKKQFFALHATICTDMKEVETEWDAMQEIDLKE